MSQAYAFEELDGRAAEGQREACGKTGPAHAGRGGKRSQRVPARRILQHGDDRLGQKRVRRAEEPSRLGSFLIGNPPNEQDQTLFQEGFSEGARSQGRRCKFSEQSFNGAPQWIAFAQTDGYGAFQTIEEAERAAIGRFDRAACGNDLRHAGGFFARRGDGEKTIG